MLTEFLWYHHLVDEGAQETYVGIAALERPPPSFPTTSFRHLFGLQIVANVFVTMWSLSFPDICAFRVHKNSYIFTSGCV